MDHLIAFIALQAVIVPLILVIAKKDYKAICTQVSDLELSQERQKKEINYVKECVIDMARLLIKSNTHYLQLIGSITIKVDISADCPNQREQTGKISKDLLKNLLKIQLIETNFSNRKSVLGTLENGYDADLIKGFIERAEEITENLG